MSTPSRLELERFVLDDLTAEERARLESAISADDALASRVERLRAELDAIAPEVPAFEPPWEAPTSAEPSRPEPRSAWRWSWARRRSSDSSRSSPG